MRVHNGTLDRTFFALSDPTRRSILERLAHGPATIGELAEPFGLTLNGVKKHVGILETVDLVVTAKVGRARECRLGPAQLEDATGWIEDYRRAWERRLDRFGAVRGGAPMTEPLRIERVIDAPPRGGLRRRS